MVDPRSTGSGIVDNTFLVAVEDRFTRSDTHGGRTTGNSSFETANRESDAPGSACNRGASTVSPASSLFLDVRVLTIFLNLIGRSVVVRVFWGAAIASLAQGVAVNDLLLGELHKLSGLLEPRAFNASNGGESPA